MMDPYKMRDSKDRREESKGRTTATAKAQGETECNGERIEDINSPEQQQKKEELQNTGQNTVYIHHIYAFEVTQTGKIRKISAGAVYYGKTYKIRLGRALIGSRFPHTIYRDS